MSECCENCKHWCFQDVYFKDDFEVSLGACTRQPPTAQTSQRLLSKRDEERYQAKTRTRITKNEGIIRELEPRLTKAIQDIEDLTTDYSIGKQQKLISSLEEKIQGLHEDNDKAYEDQAKRLEDLKEDIWLGIWPMTAGDSKCGEWRQR